MQKDLNESDHNVEMVDAAPVVRIARKVRKPSEPEVVEPTFSRGMHNNGLIEIMNDTDDDTDGEGNYVFGHDDPKDLNSKVFRVPEKGVILDFVSKVKRYAQSSQSVFITVTDVFASCRIAKQYEARKAAKAVARRTASMHNFFAHSIQQQQAALNLTQLAKRESDVGLGEGKVSALILTLTVRPLPCAPLVWVGSSALIRVKQSEAPSDVITAFDNAAPPPLTEAERAQLLKLEELIQRRLKA